MDTTAEHLCVQYRKLVYQLAGTTYHKLPKGSVMGVDDIAQEGFLELTRVADKYQPARGSASNFVTVVVRNRFYHLLTRGFQKWHHAPVPVAEPQHHSPGVAPEQDLVAALYDSLRAGQVVMKDRYRALREADLHPGSSLRTKSRLGRPGRKQFTLDQKKLGAKTLSNHAAV